MPSDSEYPFGVALAGGAFLAALALAVGEFAALTGATRPESVAVLTAAPLAVAAVLAVAVRGRLGTRRRAALFVAGVAVLAAMLELAAVGVAADGVDRRFVAGAVLVVLTSAAMLRLDPATGAG
jgi:hypothetical protein